MTEDLASLLNYARAKGSDAEFRAWVQRQPSCLSGQFSEWLESGERRCLAAHVRRANESGTAFKGEYACVPLTRAEHDLQHQHGEAACLAITLDTPIVKKLFGGLSDDGATRAAKEWFDEQRLRYLRLWLSS